MSLPKGHTANVSKAKKLHGLKQIKPSDKEVRQIMQIRKNILEPWFMLHPMLNVTPQVKKPWNNSENLFFTDKSKILQCSLVADTNDLFLLFFLRSANMSTVWSKALKFCWKEKKYFLSSRKFSFNFREPWPVKPNHWPLQNRLY